MTPRPAASRSRWTGIIFLLISVSLAESQTPPSALHNTPPSASTNLLHKTLQEGNVPALALNDGERKLPFQSSTTPASWSGEWIENSTAPRINKEQHLPSNQSPLEPSPISDVQSLPDIDSGAFGKPNELPKKHLIERLIASSHTQNQDSKPQISPETPKRLSIPEFNEKDDYSDIEDSDKFGDKEPTTAKPQKNPDVMISLLNDTNINYKGLKKEHVDDVIMKNSKITNDNATNVISREPDAEFRAKDPKAQVETIKNVESPKLLKIVETEKNDKTSESSDTSDTSSKISELPAESEPTDTRETFVHFDSKRLKSPENTSLPFEVNSTDVGERNLSPKGRTISFNGNNQFSNTGVKTPGTTKETAELTLTKEPKPYPYVKSSQTPPGNSSRPRVSTEEISPLENTIAKSPDEKKLVITESSVVIDNSIQQIKPTYFKRSGNLSKASDATSRVTPSATQKTEPADESNTQTESTVLGNSRDLREEIIEKKNSLDENVVLEKVNATESPVSRATEANLVQNGTEPDKTLPTETATVKDSLLMESPLNVTEDFSKSTTFAQTPSNTQTTPNPPESSPIMIPGTVSTIHTTTAASVASATRTVPNNTEFSNSTSQIDTESTSPSVEYEFIGLTESTSPSYASSADGTELASTSAVSTTSSLDTTSLTIQDSPNRENVTASPMDDGLTTELTIESITEISTISTEMDTTIYTASNIDLGETDTTTIIPKETNPTTLSGMGTEMGEGDSPNSMDSTSRTGTIVTTVSAVDADDSTATSTSPGDPTGTEPSEETTTVMNTEGGGRGVTEQPFVPEDVNLQVQIVVEGTWNDVCPHVSALRQSLADLLTAGIENIVSANQIIFQKNPCSDQLTQSLSAELALPTLYLYVVDQNGIFDAAMTRILPSLYSRNSIKSQLSIRSFQLVQDADSGNAIAVVVVSCVAFICLVLLAGLLFIMRKRQTRFNYGERCRPVSLDAFSLDSVSAYNSVRRKGANRASKRSYGNPTFEDSTAVPSHPLNFSGLSAFCNEQSAIYEEYSGIPQVSARIDELPPGAEVKNRFANVVPLPETRVHLAKINNDSLSEYINASYVRGPKNATKYYIACQGPIESTVTDFWRMIWEQQSKVIIMLTDLIENGVEKCAEYIPPSEVTDCHRLFGDYQVTLKKRETKEKYAISTLHLKNLENNTYREISHIWYLWPANGVQTDAAGLIAVLLEARALQRGGPVPIVVHCSPGTGRTGTLIALDLGIRQYEITRTVDVPRVVYTIRRDRAGAVQTKEQYAFIYKALNLYATKLAGGGLEST